MYSKHRSLKRVSYFLIFVIQENEIYMSVNRDPLFFRFVNRGRKPPCTTLSEGLAVAKSKIDSLGTDITVTLKIVERSSTGLGKGKEGK